MNPQAGRGVRGSEWALTSWTMLEKLALGTPFRRCKTSSTGGICKGVRCLWKGLRGTAMGGRGWCLSPTALGGSSAPEPVCVKFKAPCVAWVSSDSLPR